MVPCISVVIPVFNGEDFITAAVESALNQTVRDLEVLIADNGSTDGTWTRVQALAAGDPRVRPLRALSGRGPAVARNAALDHARGEWIAVLDADDVMHRDRLHRLLDLASVRQACLVADNQRIVDAEGRLFGLAWPPDDLPACVDGAGFVLRNLDGRRSMVLGYIKPMFRRSLIVERSLRYRTDLRIGEDYLFVLSLIRSGNSLHLCPNAYYDYVQRPTSLSRSFGAGNLIALRAAVREEMATTSAGTALGDALRRQISVIEAHLSHTEFIAALKVGNVGRALAQVLANPAVIPMILWYGRESVAKRAMRLGRWLRGRALRGRRPVSIDCTPMAAPRRQWRLTGFK